MSNEEKLKQTFKNWPATNRFWQTSDGECFFTEPKAIGHSKKLKDKSFKLHRRSDLEKVQTAEKPKSTNKK